MSLSEGTQLGPYSIVAPLGAGGPASARSDFEARIGDIAVAQFLLGDNASIGVSRAGSPRLAGMIRVLPWLLAAVVLGLAGGWLLGRRPAATRRSH